MPVESKEVERLWRRSNTKENATETVRVHVRAARAFARHAGRPQTNARLEGEALRRHARLDGPAEHLLADAARRWVLSARAVQRTLRVARTVADLSGAEAIPEAAVAEALSYRADVHGQ